MRVVGVSTPSAPSTWFHAWLLVSRDSLGDACTSNAGKPARVREVHWRVVRGVRHGGVAWRLVMQHCGIAAEVTRPGVGGPPREALYTFALRGVR